MKATLTILALFVCLSLSAQYSLDKEENRVLTYTAYEKWHPAYDLAAMSATLILPQENGYALHYAVSYTATAAFQELLFRNTELPKWGCSVLAGIAVMSAGMAKETHLDSDADAMDVVYSGIGVGVGILVFNLKF